MWTDDCFEDPLRDGRKGTALLPTLLETHAQVDVITLMLGTNDCKTVFGASADVIGKGILRLLDQIQEYAPKAKVLLMSPIYLGEKVWQEGYDQEFSRESVAVSRNLQSVYEKIAKNVRLNFFRQRLMYIAVRLIRNTSMHLVIKNLRK